MVHIDYDIKIEDRKHAANVLGQLLKERQMENAVVTAIPPGGAAMGYHMAKLLGVPLQVISCKEIEHPRDSRKSIGSICENEKVIHSFERGIPSDYISNQISRLQHSAKVENDIFNSGKEVIHLKDKTVILVIDKLKNADDMLACINCIKKEKPVKIIAAVAFADPEAARIIDETVDELLFLHTDPSHLHENFDSARDEETKHFFDIHEQLSK